MNGTDNSKLSTDENIIKDELSIDKLYENFSLQASDLREVMDSFEMLKRKLGIEKLHGLELYRELKAKLGARNSKTWKAREVLNMIEKRANQKEYMEQTAAKGIHVLIVGAGPIGLRLAIDCILLGAEVVVMEKRDSFSRNNVLHLWPFTIEDLKQLGAKKFYGKFCAGAIDHISIRSLQCILLKLCLLLGVKIHYGVEFLEILEPNEEIGWHASVFPEDHPISLFEFDFIVGAEGARKSRMPGFDRKELRGKLALAITANFKNYYTREEAAVEEISGVAFIFNQKFFKDLKADTDIDLENIVYYKDDTHYFVMTAKKDSLLTKGVLREDYSDTIHLLDRNNIDEGRLWDYAIEAAAWSTELPKLDFAFNHHKKPDVALFDFTSIHQAEYAARAIRRGGKDLYLCLIGDALLEPFWPTGTGCARGFLGAMDTAWLIRGAGQGKKVLDLLCERECIFQRLPQTTPEKLQQNIKTYTIDPQSRYPNLHFHRIQPTSVKHLYDTDELSASPALQPISGRTKNTAGVAEGGAANVTEEKAVQSGSAVEDNKENIPKTASTKEGRAVTSPSRKPLMEKGEIHRAYYVNIDDESLHTLRDHRTLIKWLQSQVKPYGIVVNNLSSSWSNGMALCALIHRYRPDLIPNFNELSPENSVENNQLAFSLAEKHLAISSLIKPTEMTKPDKLAMFTYLSLFYELFEDAEPVELSVSTPAEAHRELSPLREEGSEGVLTSGEQISSPEKSVTSPKKKKSRRRSRQMMHRGTKKSLATSPSSVERSWSSNVQRPRFTPPTSPTGKTNTPEVPSTLAIKENKAPVSTVSAAPRTPKSSRSRPLSSAGTSQFKVSAPDSSDFCYFCGKRVYLMERMSANGLFFHRNCFKCSHCNCKLKMGNYSLSKGEGGEKGKFFCSVHYRQLFMSNPEAINYSRADAPKREQSKTDLPAEEKSTQQMNSKPEQEMTKSKSVEDAMQRTEQVHISVEEVTEQSSELPENEAEVLSGDEHRELNGDLPTDEDLVPEDLVSNGVHLEEEIIEMVADLQANEEAGHGDLLEDESTPKPVRKAPAPPLHRQGSKQQTSSPKEKRNTPKPARKAPPPPSNHVVVNEDVEQISGESSSNASEEVPISPEPKARSSSDSKVEVSESRKSRSSRSRSSSVEIDENVHRDLEQQRDQPLSNEQANSQMGKSSSSGRQAPVRPAPYRPSSGSPAPIRPAPVRPAPYSPAPVRPAPYSPPSDRQTSGNSTSAQPAGSGRTVPVRPAPYSPASDRRMSASPAPVRPAPYRPAGAGSSGIVKRLSMGFEQLEANAQENKIVLGAKGREKAKANLKKVPSTTELQPYKQLDIINEEKHLPRPVSPNSFRRPRSPCEWKGTLGRRRQQPEDVAHIPRSSATTHVSDRYTWSRKPKRGQRSVTRPMISSYATSDVAIQERRKQQRRFRDAQLIQREMSQLERQYDELEEVGRNIESALRDAEDGAQEDQLMKSWLSLVNERNGLVRKTAELSLKMKELELEDKQYEVDKELNELCQVSHHQMSKQQHKRFEELCELKLKVVEERNEIVMQTEEERVRELEEDETTSTMFDKHFGGGYDGSSSDEDEQQFREQQLPPANLRKNSVENGVPSNRTEKRKSSRLSSLLSIFSSK